MNKLNEHTVELEIIFENIEAFNDKPARCRF